VLGFTAPDFAGDFRESVRYTFSSFARHTLLGYSLIGALKKASRKPVLRFVPCLVLCYDSFKVHQFACAWLLYWIRPIAASGMCSQKKLQKLLLGAVFKIVIGLQPFRMMREKLLYV
jgi:hypothetical protein